MPRRIPDYNMMFANFNMVSSVGAFMFGATQLLFLFIVIKCIRGARTGQALGRRRGTGMERALAGALPHLPAPDMSHVHEHRKGTGGS